MFGVPLAFRGFAYLLSKLLSVQVSKLHFFFVGDVYLYTAVLSTVCLKRTKSIGYVYFTSA